MDPYFGFTRRGYALRIFNLTVQIDDTQRVLNSASEELERVAISAFLLQTEPIKIHSTNSDEMLALIGICVLPNARNIRRIDSGPIIPIDDAFNQRLNELDNLRNPRTLSTPSLKGGKRKRKKTKRRRKLK